MTTPPPDALGETKVHRVRLLGWAKTWDEQSHAIGNIAKEIGGMGMPVNDSDPLHDACVAYNDVAAQIGKWTNQGQFEMMKIAAELVRASKKYGATEEEIIKATHGDLR